MYSDSTLSVKDATGRHISLLNESQRPQEQQEQATPTPSYNGKRKYHCTEPGCNKSFTTSGHLARHHRIHTGEKNFHCLHPGCPSRFSRQDNMMQHYRTHLSPKSRRHHQQHQPQQQRNNAANSIKDHPRLHCHTLVGSEEHSAMHPLIDTKLPSEMMDCQYQTSSNTNATRSRRATTMPSSFQPCSPASSTVEYKRKQLYQTSSHPPMVHPPHHRHHHSTVPHLNSLIQPLGKPLPMEPDSTPSPTSIITSPTCMDGNNTTATTPSPDTYYPHHHHNHHHLYQPYQVSRRPQRAHSASSTCSLSTVSSSFLSPRQSSLSPPPLVDQTDIIYPKQCIQLPPPPLQQQQQQEKNQLQHHITSQGHHHRQGLLDLAHTVSIFG